MTIYGRIILENNLLTLTCIKFNKEIYWITTPHGIYLSFDKEYDVIYQNKIYKATLFKQSYSTDLAIFKVNIKIKISETKIIKSNKNIKEIIINDCNIKGKINIVYNNFLDLKYGFRNIYYQINGNRIIKEGESGTGLFHKNKLVGIIFCGIEKTVFLIPAFFFEKTLQEKNSAFISFLPLKLKIKENKLLNLISYKELEENEIIEKVDGFKVSNGCIFNYELKDYIPVDVYIHVFSKNEIKINDKILSICNLNDFLNYPFLSAYHPYTERSYQHIMESGDDIEEKIIYNLQL